MATGTAIPLTDARVWHDGVDLSGQANQVGINASSNAIEKTTYDSGGWREFHGGLKQASLNITTILNEAVAPAFPTGAVAVTSIGVTGDEFAVVYGFSGLTASLGVEAEVGQLVMQPVGIEGTGLMFRGELLLPKAAQTSAGNGTARQLGAVVTGEKMVAALHVFAATGGSVTALVESDDNSGMSSATTRATFAAASAAGSELVTVDGPITDDYWRVRWTQTASSATFAVAVGIQ